MMSGNQAAPTGRGPRWPAVGVLILIMVGAYWIWRGPVRGLAPETGSADLRLIAASARGFVHGANPYDLDAIAAYWPASSGEKSSASDWRHSYDLLYPPSAFVVMAPVAFLPWMALKLTWIALNVVALVVVLMSLWRMMGDGLAPSRQIALIVIALILAPIVSTFSLGQTSLLTLGLIAGGHWARLARLWWLSGVLLGLAAALKPQIGVVFVAYELFRLRWRAGLLALLVAGACLGIGAVQLNMAGVDWAPALRENVAQFMTVGEGDPTMANPMRYQLINLQTLLHVLTENRRLAGALVWLVVGGMALAYFLYWLRRREGPDELLTLSMACPLTLLLAYHRSYDAVLLLIPIAWALREIGRYRSAEARSVWPGLVALGCCAVWLAPTDAILFWLEGRGAIGEAITGTIAYQLVVVPHRTWTLLVLGVTLIVAMARRRPRAPAAMFKRQIDAEPSASAARGWSPSSPTTPGPTPT